MIKKGSDPSGADDVLVGIVSWGLGCADDVFPGGTCVMLYKYFFEWIVIYQDDHSQDDMLTIFAFIYAHAQFTPVFQPNTIGSNRKFASEA